MKHLSNKVCAACAGLALAVSGAVAPEAEGCTRVTFVGDSGLVITGRSLDWKNKIPTNVYVFPRGLHRVSHNTDQSIDWTSAYASVCAVGYDCGVTEGMNEKGVVVNLLYLPGTSYAAKGDKRPFMSTALWASYVLDNFATVSEAVAQLRLDKFQINAPAMPGGAETTLHMAISDATGNNAIIEYVDGKLQIHEGHQYQVLTNAPPYDEQLSIARYWQAVGGLNMLPGTSRSQDRFARATFYLEALPKNSPHDVALGGVTGIIANCSVPTGISVPDQPEISTTQWRSVADQTECVYYFHVINAPGTFWVNLRDFDIYAGAPVMRLDVFKTQKPLVGNVIRDFKRAKDIEPMYEMTPELASKLMAGTE